MTFPSTVAYTGWGPTQPVYAPLTSIITLNSGAPINVTGTTALWFYMPNENALALAPMYYSIPGYNILSVTSTSGWDGSSAYTSSYIDGSGFAYFVNIATDHGSLTMDSGSVNLVTISGDAPVPEPSTLVLAAMGGLGMLWQFRRRK